MPYAIDSIALEWIRAASRAVDVVANCVSVALFRKSWTQAGRLSQWRNGIFLISGFKPDQNNDFIDKRRLCNVVVA